MGFGGRGRGPNYTRPTQGYEQKLDDRWHEEESKAEEIRKAADLRERRRRHDTGRRDMQAMLEVVDGPLHTTHERKDPILGESAQQESEEDYASDDLERLSTDLCPRASCASKERLWPDESERPRDEERSWEQETSWQREEHSYGWHSREDKRWQEQGWDQQRWQEKDTHQTAWQEDARGWQEQQQSRQRDKEPQERGRWEQRREARNRSQIAEMLNKNQAKVSSEQSQTLQQPAASGPRAHAGDSNKSGASTLPAQQAGFAAVAREDKSRPAAAARNGIEAQPRPGQKFEMTYSFNGLEYGEEYCVLKKGDVVIWLKDDESWAYGRCARKASAEGPNEGWFPLHYAHPI
mmetsp:Transcript_46417/g.86744  ORF Transcript_46417/g.86744 Transcript_46417/m.86744 type:complete len:350 (-) Transcript_46417:42-1091(-)